MINTTIMGNWHNWARVLLMFYIALFAMDLVHMNFTKKEMVNG